MYIAIRKVANKNWLFKRKCQTNESIVIEANRAKLTPQQTERARDAMEVPTAMKDFHLIWQNDKLDIEVLSDNTLNKWVWP